MKSVFLHTGGWSVAVNSACFLAYQGDVGAQLEGTPNLPTLQSLPKRVRKVSLKALRDWTSGVDPQMSVVETVPEPVQGMLAGIAIDLRKFAFFLEVFPSDGDLVVGASTKDHGVKSIGFEVGNWRGCLAGIDTSARRNPFEEFQSLIREPPQDHSIEVGDSPFDLMLELESE